MVLTPEQNEVCNAEFEAIKELITRRSKDNSYVNEYKRFIRWVAANNLGEVGKWITRESVDEYFRIAVVLRTCAKPSISRIVQSLQWFYDNLESPGGGFVVKCPVVESLINQQQENRTNMPSSALGTDPRKGLKDVLSEPEKK